MREIRVSVGQRQTLSHFFRCFLAPCQRSLLWECSAHRIHYTVDFWSKLVLGFTTVFTPLQSTHGHKHVPDDLKEANPQDRIGRQNLGRSSRVIGRPDARPTFRESNETDRLATPRREQTRSCLPCAFRRPLTGTFEKGRDRYRSPGVFTCGLGRSGS